MKRVKCFLLAAAICFCFYGKIVAQDNYPLQGTRVMLAVNGMSSGCKFYSYTPYFKASALYRSQSEVSNAYPEQLMSSLLSANNQEWYNSNMLPSSGLQVDKAAEYFDRVKTMDRDQVYYELVCKFEFDYQGEQMAVVKFYMHISKDQSFPGAFVLQKRDGRWYRTSTPFTTDLALLFSGIKGERLKQVFEGKKTGDKLVDALVLRVRNAGGSISLEKFIQEYKAWQSNSQSATFNHFKDPMSW